MAENEEKQDRFVLRKQHTADTKHIDIHQL